MDETNSFEKFPGSSGEVSGENLKKAAEWGEAMSSGVPEFAGASFLNGTDKGSLKKVMKMGEGIGEQMFGTANEQNKFYGEANDANDEIADEQGEMYDKGISDAAALINYGLNAAALKYGVEVVVQKIKNFDASGSSDPIGDFFNYMGVDAPAERQNIVDQSAATTDRVSEFRDGVNNPSQKKSTEGAFAAIDDMKELINEVEGADPRYEELRQGAKAAGKGYFDYAVSDYGVRDLTGLFKVLATQREKAEEKEEASTVENNNDYDNNDDELTVEEKIEKAEQLNPEIVDKNAA